MGVPGFFMWLWKNYKTRNFVFQKDNIKDNMLNDIINTIDYLLIDTNCLIHPMCFKVLAENSEIKNNDNLEELMIKKVLEYITYLIDYIKPKKGVFIAIDGVAPIAKIKQQRSRRFKSVHDRELWDKIKQKHKKPINHFWNNSAITPGTYFMFKLHNNILEWSAKQKLQIIYSSCNTPSEGEHKLLQFIRNNQKQNKTFSYVLYGLDADLIFLALSTQCDMVYLLREANQMDSSEKSESLNFVSIKIMKECIIETIYESYKKLNESDIELISNNVINDFIFLCYLLGNDFLPHLPSLNINKNGIEILVEMYVKTLFETQSYLLKINKHIKVNNIFLVKLLKMLSNKEEEILKLHFGKNKRKLYCSSSERYDIEIFKIENLQFEIIDNVMLGTDNHTEWRKRYYKHYFGCMTEESIDAFCEDFVNNYLIGLKWVTMYYFDKCPSWDWYFPYDHPPFLLDIVKYIEKININKIGFSEGQPLEPFEQLLCVLPQQSAYLIPQSLKKLMTNGMEEIAHLYPTDFNQDMLNKSKYWMAIPLLPPLEIDLVKKVYNSNKHLLTKDEQFRNRICDDIIFN